MYIIFGHRHGTSTLIDGKSERVCGWWKQASAFSRSHPSSIFLETAVKETHPARYAVQEANKGGTTFMTSSVIQGVFVSIREGEGYGKESCTEV